MFKNLRQARNNPKDEFYTHLIDIEKELSNYKEQLKNKVIYCNTSLQAQLKPVNWCKGIKIDDNESKLTSTYEEADTMEDYEGAKHYVYTKDGELIEFWVSSYGKIYTIHSQVILRYKYLIASSKGILTQVLIFTIMTLELLFLGLFLYYWFNDSNNFL